MASTPKPHKESDRAFILRKRVQSDYTVLPNSIVRDKRLSFKAKGLLWFLLSLPPDWQIRLKHLATIGSDGRVSIATAVSELCRAGYLLIVRTRDDMGRYVTSEWTVTDTPEDHPRSGFPNVDNPNVGNPDSGKPAADSPTSENPHLQSTVPNKLRIETTTTSNEDCVPHDSAGTLVVVGQSFEQIAFPPNFTPEDQKTAKTMLAKCPEALRQRVVNEVAGIWSKGKLRGSPVGLLHGLIERAVQGRFFPSEAIKYEARLLREAEEKARAEEARLERERANTPEAIEARRLASERALAQMRATLSHNRKVSTNEIGGAE